MVMVRAEAAGTLGTLTNFSISSEGDGVRSGYDQVSGVRTITPKPLPPSAPPSLAACRGSPTQAPSKPHPMDPKISVEGARGA